MTLKKIILIFSFIPLIIFSQNGEISFDKSEFDIYLDFANNSMKGSSTAQAIFNAKKALKTDEYDSFGINGDAELMIHDDGNNFIKTNEGTYLHVVKNSRVGTYLGFNGIGQYFPWIYIYSKEKDIYKENNVIRVNTRLLFMRRYATDSKLGEIMKITYNSINEYFINKCTTGLVNAKSYNDATRMGHSFNEVFDFNVMGKDVVEGGIQELNSCISDCETCLFEVDFGYTNKGSGINDGYSHILYIGFINTAKKAAQEVTSDMDDWMYNYNFIIYDYKGIEGNKLDLRDVNNYDLKSMINFFIEDYNRFSNKVFSKKLSPVIFKEEQINATFESLEGNEIALSYGMNDDSKIIIKIDPEKWANASEEKRWYIIYHELGHDILNLEHGEGGKMMFNFADKDYSWDDFIEDKKYMFSSN